MSDPEYQTKNGAMSLPEVVARTVLSSKTLSTRLSPEELEEVEQAAQRDGSTRSEWMRAVLLREARKFRRAALRAALRRGDCDPNLLTNYLVASAQVATENKQLSRNDVLQMIQFSNGRRSRMRSGWFRNGTQRALPEGGAMNGWEPRWIASSNLRRLLFYVLAPVFLCAVGVYEQSTWLERYYIFPYLESSVRRHSPADTTAVEMYWKVTKMARRATI